MLGNLIAALVVPRYRRLRRELAARTKELRKLKGQTVEQELEIRRLSMAREID